jgi:hypothetical protein
MKIAALLADPSLAPAAAPPQLVFALQARSRSRRVSYITPRRLQ